MASPIRVGGFGLGRLTRTRLTDHIELHLEPADLLVQLGLASLSFGRGWLGTVGEDSLGAGEQLLLPGVDELRMDAVVPGQFVDGSVSIVGSQGDLGLEPRRVDLSLDPHLSPPSGLP